MAGVLTFPRPTTASLSAPTPSTRRLHFAHFNPITLPSPNASLSLSLSHRRSRVSCEAKGAAVEVSPVSDESWQSLVLECDSAVLVEFWAPWCGPCRMIHPVIDELAKEYTGKLKCYKVNTDECPSIATRYGIRSIPTVMVFKNGEKKDAVIGAVPKTTLCTCIEKFI